MITQTVHQMSGLSDYASLVKANVSILPMTEKGNADAAAVSPTEEVGQLNLPKSGLPKGSVMNGGLSEEEQVILLRKIIESWDHMQVPVQTWLELLGKYLQERGNQKLVDYFTNEIMEPWEKLEMHTYITDLPEKNLQDYKSEDFIKYFKDAQKGIEKIKSNLSSLLKIDPSIRRDQDPVKGLVRSLNTLLRLMINPVVKGSGGTIRVTNIDLNELIDRNLMRLLIEDQQERFKLIELQHEWRNKVAAVQGNLELLQKRYETLRERGLNKFNKTMQALGGEFLSLYKTFLSIREPQDFNNYFEQSRTIVLDMRTQVKNLKSRYPSFFNSRLGQGVEDSLNNALGFIEGHDPVIHLQKANLSKIINGNLPSLLPEPPIIINAPYSKDVADVDVDPGKIGQVILNIVQNAKEAISDDIKAYREEGETRPPGEINIITKEVGSNKILIEISDNGPGIKEPVQDKIFEPEFSTTKPDGIGLGMWFVQKMVKDHGGTITFKTTRHEGPVGKGFKTGEGTTFFIELPRNGSTASHPEAGSMAMIAGKSRGRGQLAINGNDAAMFIRDKDMNIEWNLGILESEVNETMKEEILSALFEKGLLGGWYHNQSAHTVKSLKIEFIGDGKDILMALKVTPDDLMPAALKMTREGRPPESVKKRIEASVTIYNSTKHTFEVLNPMGKDHLASGPVVPKKSGLIVQSKDGHQLFLEEWISGDAIHDYYLHLVEKGIKQREAIDQVELLMARSLARAWFGSVREGDKRGMIFLDQNPGKKDIIISHNFYGKEMAKFVDLGETLYGTPYRMIVTYITADPQKLISNSDNLIYGVEEAEGQEKAYQFFKDAFEEYLSWKRILPGNSSQLLGRKFFENTNPSFLEYVKDQLQSRSERDSSPSMAVEVKNKAMAVNGGIDLTSDKALSVQNYGQGIKFHIDPEQLAQLQNARGFVPEIINIEPLGDLRKFLGAASL